LEQQFQISKEFESAARCLQYLLEAYPRDSREQIWLDQPDSNLIVPHSVPRFLFRGECGRFEKTIASAGRPETWALKDGLNERAKLSPTDCDKFQHLSKWLLELFTKLPDYDLSPFEALAIQQHYGLPTATIDFTADPAVAVAFAVCGNNRADRGRICVMPTESYLKGVNIANLSEHRWAARACRQEAFAIMANHGQPRDLKSDYARNVWGIRWFEFQITERDRQLCADRHSKLIATRDDATAGILRFHLIEYVEHFGKLSANLAKWLVNRDVPMVPRVYNVLRFAHDCALTDHVPPSRVGQFDEKYERDQTERYLSEKSSDDSRTRVQNWIIPPVGSIVADPRTFHGRI
jgi:hypothetical protein